MHKTIIKWFVPFIPIILVFLSLGIYYACLTGGLVAPRNSKKLVIDHDGGADDAMAIFIALQYQKYFNGPKLVALTTTHGNVNESQAYENSQKFLNIANEENIPIYRGATNALLHDFPKDDYFGSDGLGNSENEISYDTIAAEAESAAIGLIELSKKYIGQLIVLSIGPSTNIALAMKLDPDFMSRLSHLYIAAGGIYSKEYLKPEFNAAHDAEAYFAVMQEAKPETVTVLPFSEVYKSLNISMDWRRQVLGRIPTNFVKVMNRFELVVFQEEEFIYLDPVAAAVVMDTTFIEETKKSKNSIILCGQDRGVNTNLFEDPTPNVNLIYSMNKDKYKDFLVRVFSAGLN